jgi:hypothetical protein
VLRRPCSLGIPLPLQQLSTGRCASRGLPRLCGQPFASTMREAEISPAIREIRPRERGCWDRRVVAEHQQLSAPPTKSMPLSRAGARARVDVPSTVFAL